MRTVIIFLFCSFSISAQWTQNKGKGYYKVGVWWLEANKHYTNEGFIDPNATRGLFITNFYANYGLLDKLSLKLYVPYTRIYQNKQVFTSGSTPINGEAFSDLGDIDLGMEYQLLNNKGWAISSSIMLGIPSGNTSGGSDGSYQTGDGEFNQLIQLHLGKSYRIGKRYFYGKIALGYNNRSKGYSDEWRWGFETGTHFFKDKVLVLVRANSIQSFFNGTLSAANSNGSIFANNVEVTNVGGALIYNFNSTWSVNLSADMPIVGKIIYKGNAFAMGIAAKL